VNLLFDVSKSEELNYNNLELETVPNSSNSSITLKEWKPAMLYLKDLEKTFPGNEKRNIFC
jgi:hypothetical protein